MAMRYTVTYSKPGSNQPSHPFDNLDDAIRHAAKLARVTPRTIRNRFAKSNQVGGREIGAHGVWIEEAE